MHAARFANKVMVITGAAHYINGTILPVAGGDLG